MAQYGASLFRDSVQIAFAWIALSVASACGDIYHGEYINPADPSQGKRQSTTLCIGGAGVDAVPNAYLPDRDLSRHT